MDNASTGIHSAEGGNITLQSAQQVPELTIPAKEPLPSWWSGEAGAVREMLDAEMTRRPGAEASVATRFFQEVYERYEGTAWRWACIAAEIACWANIRGFEAGLREERL